MILNILVTTAVLIIKYLVCHADVVIIALYRCPSFYVGDLKIEQT